VNGSCFVGLPQAAILKEKKCFHTRSPIIGMVRIISHRLERGIKIHDNLKTYRKDFLKFIGCNEDGEDEVADKQNSRRVAASLLKSGNSSRTCCLL